VLDFAAQTKPATAIGALWCLVNQRRNWFGRSRERYAGLNEPERGTRAQSQRFDDVLIPCGLALGVPRQAGRLPMSEDIASPPSLFVRRFGSGSPLIARAVCGLGLSPAVLESDGNETTRIDMTAITTAVHCVILRIASSHPGGIRCASKTPRPAPRSLHTGRHLLPGYSQINTVVWIKEGTSLSHSN
jgi:hypothetical protein